ncbi:uncharacterized protein HaLaN_23413, partial [Haematococcus lacustris]
SAFKASTDARSLRCIASLSRTYPGTGQLALAKWEAMNSLVSFMSVLTAPGKTNEVVHKDLREVRSASTSVQGQGCQRHRHRPIPAWHQPGADGGGRHVDGLASFLPGAVQGPEVYPTGAAF